VLAKATNLASLSRTLWETLESNYGLDPAPIFAAARLTRSDLADPARRISFEEVEAIWTEAIRVTGDEYIGIAVGPNFRVANAGVLGFSWMASASLMDALERQARYYHLLSTAADMRIENQGELTRVFFETHVEVPNYAHHSILATTLKLCRRASSDQFSPKRATFAGAEPPPADLARFKAWFRCPIRFEQNLNAMYFSTAELEKPLPAANPALIAGGEKILQNQLRAVDDDTLAGRVREMVIRDLPSGGASADDVARRLNRSVSSLQRHLRAEGTSFREVVESCRHDLARSYLRESEQPLAEIAFLLGYADQSGFTRAFTRWEGVSPGEFRRSGANDDPVPVFGA
jgi:AraC-like DNA-binding protein